jgi:uncharacterized DUF497 family protein
MAEDFAPLFARVRDFDWDPAKRETNLRGRQIDFADARFVLDRPTMIRRSDRKGETRYNGVRLSRRRRGRIHLHDPRSDLVDHFGTTSEAR